jgi:chromosome segregation ATPase
MARLDDVKQVNRELEDFRFRAQSTLENLEKLGNLLSEFSSIKQEYESGLKHISEKIEQLDHSTTERNKEWTSLQSKLNDTVKHLNNTEEDLLRRFSDLQKEIDHSLRKFQEDILTTKKNLAEIKQTFESHSSQFNEFRQENDQRFTETQEEIAKAQDDLQTADRNLRTELTRMINDLHGESEGRFSEINQILDKQAHKLDKNVHGLEVRIDETHDALKAEIDVSRQESKDLINRIVFKIENLGVRNNRLQKWLILVTLFQIILAIGMVFIFER